MLIINAASGDLAITPDNGLAAGSLFSVIAFDLEAGDSVSVRLRTTGDERDLAVLPSLKLAGGGVPSFTAQIPEDTPLGEAEVVATAKSGKSGSGHVWIVASGMGLFSEARNEAGSDPPVRNQLTAPVLPGGLLTLRGTGLGRMTAADVEVEILGARVGADLAFRAPGETGVDEIRFRVPEGIPDDCYIPITVRVAGRASNQITVAKAERLGPCRHPFGLSAQQLQTLDSGASIPVSTFSIRSGVGEKGDSIGLYFRGDSVYFSVFSRYAYGVAAVAGARDPDSSVSACSSVSASAPSFSGVGSASLGFAELQPGQPAVRFPNGQAWELEELGGYFFKAAPISDDGFLLSALPPSIFEGGDWSLRLPGSAAFDTLLPVPPPLRWTNRADLQVIPQQKDITISWEPQGYSNRERVFVSLTGSDVAGRVASLRCRAPGAVGSITIPAALLSQFADPEAQLGVSLGQSNRERSTYSVGSIPGLVDVSYSEQIQIRIE